MSLPYLVTDYYNFGRGRPDNKIRVIVTAFSTRANVGHLDYFKEWIEKEKAHFILVLYRERDDECIDKSKHMEALGASLGQRLIWKKITADAIRLLTGWGIAISEELGIDDRKLQENLSIHLGDFRLGDEVDKWIKQNEKGIVFTFGMRWPVEYMPYDFTVHRRYWLLGYPEFLTPEELPTDLLYMGGPRRSLKAHKEKVSKILSNYGFLKSKEPGKYRVEQSSLESYILHYLLKNGKNRIHADELSPLVISLNEGLAPSGCLDNILSSLEEKRIIEKTGISGEYRFLPSDPEYIDTMLRRSRELIKEARETLDRIKEKDELGASLAIFEPYLRTKEADRLKEDLGYAATWGGEISLDNLRTAFTKILSKLEVIHTNSSIFQSKYNELLNESRRAGEEGLKKTKDLLRRLCNLTAPAYLLEKYIAPRLKKLRGLLGEYRQKGRSFVDSLCSTEFKEVHDASKLAKELYEKGSFEELDNLHLKVKTLKDTWGGIKGDMEQRINKLQGNLQNLKIRSQSVTQRIESLSTNPLTPKFSKYFLSLSNAYLDLNVDKEIRDKMSEKRREVFSGINIDDPETPYRIAQDLRKELDDEVERLQTMISSADRFLKETENFLSIEKEIVNLSNQIKSVNGKVDDLEGFEEAKKSILKNKSELETLERKYELLSPKEVFTKEVSDEKIAGVRRKLDEIKEKIPDILKDINKEYNEAFKRLDDERDYLSYLVSKIRDVKKRKELSEELDKYSKLRKWKGKKTILDGVFAKITDTLKAEGFHPQMLKVLKMIFDRLKVAKYGEKLNIREAMKVVSEKLGMKTTEEIDEILKIITRLIEGNFLEGYLDLRKGA